MADASRQGRFRVWIVAAATASLAHCPPPHTVAGLASVVGLNADADAAEVLKTVAETLGCAVADDGTTELVEASRLERCHPTASATAAPLC